MYSKTVRINDKETQKQVKKSNSLKKNYVYL